MLRSALLILAASAALLWRGCEGNASGYTSCVNGPDSPHNTAFNTGTPPYAITLLSGGTAVTSYVPGQTYQVRLAANTGNFKGFIIAGFRGDPGTNFFSTRAGTMTVPSGQAAVMRVMSGCSGGMTHASSTIKTTVTMNWVAPAAGTGSVTFFSIVVVSQNAANWRVYLSVPEAVTPSQSALPPTPSITLSPAGTPSGSPSLSASNSPSQAAAAPSSSSSGTPAASASSSVAPSPSSSPTLSSSASAAGMPSGTATVSSSFSGTAAPSVSSSPTATLSVSPTVSGSVTSSSTVSRSGSITSSITGTPTGTGSRGAAPSVTASNTGTAAVTPSSSSTVSTSGTHTGSASLTSTVSPSMAGTASVTSIGTASVTGSLTPSLSAAASGSGTSSSSVAASATATVSASGSAAAPTSSGTASGSPAPASRSSSLTSSASVTATASRSPTMTRSPSGSTSGSVSATASLSPTPSRSFSNATAAGEPPTSSFRYGTAFDTVLSMFWTPRLDAGVIDFKVEAAGFRWVGVAPSVKGSDMLHGGAAVIGTLDDGRVHASFLRSYLQDEISYLASLATAGVTSAGVAYNSARDVTSMWWTRALVPPNTAEDDDFTGKLGSPMGWIWAYGYSAADGGDGSFSMHENADYKQVVLYPDLCKRNTTCSGRGDCDGSGQCVCDTGYAGSTCNACAQLYTRLTNATSSSVQCTLYDSTLQTVGAQVAVTLSLRNVPNGDLRTPAQRSSFLSQLVVQLRTALRLNASLVSLSLAPLPSSVTSISNMTVIFAPGPSACVGAASASSCGATAVQGGIQKLQTDLGDSGSRLQTSDVGQYLSPTSFAGSAVRFGGASNSTGGGVSAGYQFSITDLRLKDKAPLKLSWMVEGSGDSAWLWGELRYSGNSWFGIGFSDSESMVPADSISCEPGSTTGSYVSHYLLGGYTGAENPAVPQASSLLDSTFSVLYPLTGSDGSGGSSSSTGGYVCLFKRRIRGGPALRLSSSPGSGTIAPKSLDAGEVYLISAHGSAGKMTMGVHTSQQSGALIVNFLTGATRVPVSGHTQAVFIIHALAGMAACALLLPASAYAAVFKRLWGDSEASLSSPFAVWYRYHTLFASLGSVAFWISFGLGVVSTVRYKGSSSGGDDGDGDDEDGLFKSAHGALSLAALLVLLALYLLSSQWVRRLSRCGRRDAAAPDAGFTTVQNPAAAAVQGGKDIESAAKQQPHAHTGSGYPATTTSAGGTVHISLGGVFLALCFAVVITGILGAGPPGGPATSGVVPAAFNPLTRGGVAGAMASFVAVLAAWTGAAVYGYRHRRRALTPSGRPAVASYAPASASGGAAAASPHDPASSKLQLRSAAPGGGGGATDVIPPVGSEQSLSSMELPSSSSSGSDDASFQFTNKQMQARSFSGRVKAKSSIHDTLPPAATSR